jgi:hypothetical protein
VSTELSFLASFILWIKTCFERQNVISARPAHLESKELPPAGMCNPFVMGRPDQQGYQIVDFCVDWNDINNSTLSSPFIADAGESWSPGPGSVAQPGTSQGLDTLASFGRIMYRSSFRAYPASKGLDDTLVFSFPVNLGGGHAGVRWAQVNFPTVGDPAVVNQGEYGPDDTDRWMPGISVDQDGNIGLAYSVANSSESTFPGVRFTTRNHNDPANTLRDEEVCVDGGGSQTSTSGRWGDYSSVSVDPVDECTFWASVEYQPTTANANWSNRVCSFKFENCGQPYFSMNSSSSRSVSVCSATEDIATYDFTLLSSNGFSDTVNVDLTGQPGTSTVTYTNGNSFSNFPASGGFELSNLTGLPSGEFDMTLNGTATSVSNALDYHLSISAAATSEGAVLVAPLNQAVNTDVIFMHGFELDVPLATVGLYPTFDWLAVNDALEYRLEVATDAAFSNLIIDITMTELNHTSDVPLGVNTLYYWRVTAINNCGPGQVSEVFEFTTGSFVSDTVAECTGNTTAEIVFFDDLEGDVSDWTLPAAPIGNNTWATSSAQAFSGQAFFAQDVPVSSDQYLVSPAITLPTIDQSPISLSYWNYQELETDAGTGNSACWDGGLLEISTDGGNNFTQISGAQMIGDPYNGAITNNAASPISGLQAWCASSAVLAAGEQADIAIIDLDDYAGQTVQFRFRLGTDGAVGAEGWYIDNVTVQGCQDNP